MLSSLFGDLPSPDRSGRKLRPGDDGFAATSILESVATEVNERGQMVDRHLRELVVSGNPAQAIRDHFAATRADLDTASRMITLLDPMGVWASSVVKALSDAGGQPIERLHLREQGTLRSLAMIERTTLMRRQEDALKIVHADVRAPGPENAEIPVALMERSHMTTVIVGPMQAHAVDALLGALLQAASLPTWRCPNLLFMLPPNATWIAGRIAETVWPQALAVHVQAEPMTSASSVWNAMLGAWNQVRLQAAAFGPGEGPALADVPADPTAPLKVTRAVMDPGRGRLALAPLLALEGLLGCAIVDGSTGLVVARELTADELPFDFDLAAAASAQLFRAHRNAARDTGLGEPIDEVIATGGGRQLLLRNVSAHAGLFLVAVLDRQRSNLALARFRLADVDRSLGG
jgi:hypothetical protein